MTDVVYVKRTCYCCGDFVNHKKDRMPYLTGVFVNTYECTTCGCVDYDFDKPVILEAYP